MVIGTYGLNRHLICTERGVDPYAPGYERIASYAAVTIWISQQYQIHNNQPPGEANIRMLADYNLALARFDTDLDGSVGEGSMEDFSEKFAQSCASTFSPERIPAVTDSFTEQLASMLFASQVSRDEGSDIEDLVEARYYEGYCLGDLYSQIISSQKPSSSLSNVLRMELALGCIIDSVFDYREDLESGSIRKVNTKEMAYVLGFSATNLLKYLASPHTRPGDIELMTKKFARYCKRSLGIHVAKESRVLLA
jgi:hypothetical protein